MVIKSKSPRVMLAIILAIWVGLAIFFTDPDKLSIDFLEAWSMFSFMLSSPFILILAMILRFRITINGDIRRRGLLGTNSIQVTDVKHISVESGYSKKSGKFSFLQNQFLPPLRIVIHSKDPNKRAILVNMAVVSRQGVQDLLGWAKEQNIPIK
ncbi:MAG: hypothetical protein F6K39_01870 [Okeania sp. SIO3B3]|nr:hypothetical protein [Okeania sp. SIO3B3]